MKSIYESVNGLNKYSILAQTYVDGLNEPVEEILDVKPENFYKSIVNYVEKVKKSLKQVEDVQTIKCVVGGVVKILPTPSGVNWEEKDRAITAIGHHLKLSLLLNCAKSEQFRRQRVCYYMNCKNRKGDFLA